MSHTSECCSRLNISDYVHHIFFFAVYKGLTCQSTGELQHSLQNRFFHPALPPPALSPPAARVISRWARERTDTLRGYFRFSAKTGRSSSQLRCPPAVFPYLRPYLRPFFFPPVPLLFSFRFPLHIFIRRSFLTINADHLHVRSQRERNSLRRAPSAGARATRTPVDSVTIPPEPPAR